MTITSETRCSVFCGSKRVLSGRFIEAAMAARAAVTRGGNESVLVFDDGNGRIVDIDLRGSDEDVRNWAEARMQPKAEARDARPESSQDPGQKPGRKRGRPRLGVVSREVTLLPRHWAWLGSQRGGASATLRRLVDQARKAGEQQDRCREAQDAAYRFMSAIAGDLPDYEEAIRALFAGDSKQFDVNLQQWPRDIRDYSKMLAQKAFPANKT